MVSLYCYCIGAVHKIYQPHPALESNFVFLNKVVIPINLYNLKPNNYVCLCLYVSKRIRPSHWVIKTTALEVCSVLGRTSVFSVQHQRNFTWAWCVWRGQMQNSGGLANESLSIENETKIVTLNQGPECFLLTYFMWAFEKFVEAVVGCIFMSNNKGWWNYFRRILRK